MIDVLVTKKHHDDKGILIGYTIKDSNGQYMNIRKEALKEYIVAGQVNVLNMTMTSDGRLIGRAMKNEYKLRKKTGRIADTVFTNGKHIACVLVNETEWLKSIGVTHPTKYEKITLGYNFDTGFECTQKMMKGEYDNIAVIDGKPDFTKTRKKSFKSSKQKFVDTLKANGISYDTKVEKGTEKYEYAITILGYNRFEDLDQMVQLIHILIENAMYDARIKPKHIDEDTMYVSCMTGIKDVRQALKDAGVHKL